VVLVCCKVLSKNLTLRDPNHDSQSVEHPVHETGCVDHYIEVLFMHVCKVGRTWSKLFFKTQDLAVE
jgi:hypothetical protein